MVMGGATLSLLASARRGCGFAGAPATSKSCGKPPAGGFSVTVSLSRCRMARCAGAPARMILLSGAAPTALSPGCSHSRPARESQPSGLRRSAVCAARHAALSSFQEPLCANEETERITHVERVSADLASRDRKRMGNYSARYRLDKLAKGCELNLYGELQRRDRAKANNNLARALTKPARGSVCFCTSGAPEGWPRVEICRKNLLDRL